MSLETLLEAAKYLEYRSEVKARGEEPHDYFTFSKLCTVSNDVSNLPAQASHSHRYHQSSPNSSRPTEEVKERRRPSTSISRDSVLSQEQGGTGTREVHNKLEKNRRAHLKECFESLKKQLPNMDDRKTSNLSILRGAIRYIQTLKRKEREYEQDMERLAREKIAFQQRLSSLKKDLSSQFDHIDVNSFIPEADNETTTTASECGAMSDFDDDLPREVSSASNHNSNLASDMTSSSSSSTASGMVPRSVTATTVNASVTQTLALPRQTASNVFLPVSVKEPLSKNAVSFNSEIHLPVGGKATLRSGLPDIHSIPLTNSENNNVQCSRLISASRLQAMAGILTSPHAMQVITQSSGIKILASPNSISSSTSSTEHLAVNHCHQGKIHVLSPSSVTYGTSAPVSASSSKSIIADSVVQVANSSSNATKPQLVSPVTLVSPQAFVGITQVGTMTKPLIINQTSSLSDLMTSSGKSTSLAVTQGLMKPTLSSSLLTKNLVSSTVALTVKNSLQNNNAASITTSCAPQSNMIATLHVTKSHPQIIQPSSAAQNASSLRSSEGHQVNSICRQATVSVARPHSTSITARSSLTHASGVTHIASQSPVTAPVSHLVASGNHISAVTPLVGSVSVVSHTGTVHQSQILAQSQPIGKVLASPILKSVNQIKQIPIIQQQFIQQTSGSAPSQPIIKPVVVVSMPNIIPPNSTSPLAPGPLLSANDQQRVVRNPVLGPQK